ncbi:NUDIX domain-containing protein [Rhodocyclus tenuis]|uniref:thiamine phosphate synthase n=1 Tax=Rhodocyclus gracilis TaxID=2929842 RepID=UPI00129898F6|nr:thiamine phosphate synthase [Rhodocyclus gracilis]MRD72420.1 NUDIX domain-containing protein [Rhodocyclus gracilis]
MSTENRDSAAAGAAVPPVVEVAAAVILENLASAPGGQRFMLAQRPAGKVFAGYWEFPGGKVEAGETARQALDRELNEELGISVTAATPWLCREFVYPHATVRLHFFRVTAWAGEIRPIEHSGFAWLTPGEPSPVSPILPANGPILRALELPTRCFITHAEANGADAELARLARALAAYAIPLTPLTPPADSPAAASPNERRLLIQVRDKSLPAAERQRFAAAVVALARRYAHVIVLVNDDVELARTVAADGVHLPAARLAQSEARPDLAWVGASCHNAEELARAATLGCDFVMLGPVLPTPSHPEQGGIGWEGFARLAATSALPVFALGGMRPELAATATAHGAHGIALLRGWP